jgi:cell wall-associated NlpC family hydrolase
MEREASGEALAQAAEALAGSRFRLHGRDPATGLDCVGLLAAALRAIGRPAPLPTGYAWRSRTLPALADIVRACGFAPSAAPLLPGDVMLLRPAPCQHHCAIAASDGRFVHAHAGLRRVVVMPGPPVWPVLYRWRLIQGT